jgi:hypothetical protein
MRLTRDLDKWDDKGQVRSGDGMVNARIHTLHSFIANGRIVALLQLLAALQLSSPAFRCLREDKETAQLPGLLNLSSSYFISPS